MGVAESVAVGASDGAAADMLDVGGGSVSLSTTTDSCESDVTRDGGAIEDDDGSRSAFRLTRERLAETYPEIASEMSSEIASEIEASEAEVSEQPASSGTACT